MVIRVTIGSGHRTIGPGSIGGLRPTAPTKMYNAQLTVRRSPGTPREPVAYPEDAPSTRHNYEQMLPLLKSANELVTLRVPQDIAGGGSYDAYLGEVGHETLLAAIKGLRWEEADYFQADVASLEEVSSQGISAWVTIAPQLKRAMQRVLPNVGKRTLVSRGRRRGVKFGGISDPKHRAAALRLACAIDPYGDPEVEARRRPKLGALVLYPLVEEDLEPPDSDDEIDVSKVTVGFTLVAPTVTDDGDQMPYVTFTVVSQAQANRPIINLPS